jgi:hypothetical protein
MKKLLPLFIILLSLSACKKNIDQLQQDAVIKAMTDGQWVVTSFVQNGSDITPNFSTYKFKYYANKTVDAIKNGTVEKTGTWDGNAATMTTSANFAGAMAPLSLINGSWHIDDSGWTYVIATQTVSGETRVMRLDKQ